LAACFGRVVEIAHVAGEAVGQSSALGTPIHAFGAVARRGEVSNIAGETGTRIAGQTATSAVHAAAPR
jgi:hypothetical protein